MCDNSLNKLQLVIKCSFEPQYLHKADELLAKTCTNLLCRDDLFELVCLGYGCNTKFSKFFSMRYLRSRNLENINHVGNSSIARASVVPKAFKPRNWEALRCRASLLNQFQLPLKSRSPLYESENVKFYCCLYFLAIEQLPYNLCPLAPATR